MPNFFGLAIRHQAKKCESGCSNFQIFPETGFGKSTIHFREEDFGPGSLKVCPLA
jgi:hypothetical protein